MICYKCKKKIKLARGSLAPFYCDKCREELFNFLNDYAKRDKQGEKTPNGKEKKKK